jgi:hypothetical protein
VLLPVGTPSDQVGNAAPLAIAGAGCAGIGLAGVVGKIFSRRAFVAPGRAGT